MRRIALGIRTGLLAVLILALGTAGALAASVAYEGGAEEFVFVPGNDLFTGFKDLLPGDAVQQTIAVRNESGKKVRLYLRAEPVDDSDRDLLSKLRLTVSSGSGALFDAQADEQDGLAANKLLGTFKDDGGTNLTVTLKVPIELGNDYMARVGTIPWVFLAEEIEDDDTPDTGDWFRLPLWIGAGALLLAGSALFARKSARRRGAAR